MEKFYLDIGNSHYKIAVFNGESWSVDAEGRIDRPSEFRSIVEGRGAEGQWIITSVRKDVLEMLKEFLPEERVQVIGNQNIPPERVDYRTPHTLGMDRFLVANAAFWESKKSVIVIDAGSAITIDQMNEKGVYMGGVIMPGVRVQKQSVTDHLPELPVIESVVPKDWPGKSSKECLEWGIYGSFRFALNGFIHRYRSMNADMEIYLTGGDSELIGVLIDSETHIRYRKYLLFDGMRLFAESK